MALRLACTGYAVALPNLYYRLAPQELGPIPEPDEFDRLDLLNRCVGSLTIPAVMDDTAALLQSLGSMDRVDVSNVATIGYCMSGRFAIAAAAHFPKQVKTAASFYGTWLVSEDPESPHLMATRCSGQIYFACAEHDHWVPLTIVDELRQHLKNAGSNAQVEVYEGASHAFAFPQRRQYDRLAEARHWERIASLLKKNLGQSPATQ